jgi:RecA-family ATPase
MSTPLKTITGEELMSMELPPTRMIVHKLLPQGLHILAGAPKTGKSWLTLWLCLQISKGEPVWELPTEKGNVLYLCLEDSYGRIQERMLDLTDHAPPDIHFATMADTIGGGLIKQIENFLVEYPDTNLIAIDTLQRIRNVSGELNAYANDYKDINLLKQIADKHGIGILLVHHLRKQGDDDPVNMISGTTGLTGVVDGLYVLKKDSRRSSMAKLIATGRDIEDREFTLEFDKRSHIWNFISDDSDEPFSLSAD